MRVAASRYAHAIRRSLCYNMLTRRSRRGLVLSYNMLTTLPETLFNGLTNLQSFSVPDNAISVLPAGIFDPLTSLSGLYLYNNTISVLPAGIFDKLTLLSTLDLFGNAISVLPAGIFDKLTLLSTLSLFANTISVLPAGIFYRLTSLQFLVLRCPPLFRRLEHFRGGIDQRRSSTYDYCAGDRSERDNQALACVPLTQQRIAAIENYVGPTATCQSSCTAGNAGPLDGTCTPCAAGKYADTIGKNVCVCVCVCVCVHITGGY
jgi:hypothetical protein